MKKYENAASGLKMMFIASIGAIVAGVVSVIPILGIIGSIAALVFAIMSLLGLNKAGRDIEGCKKAFMMTIGQIILNVLTNFLGGVPVVGLILNLASYVVSFLIVYFVCTSVAAVMREIGQDSIASTGETVYKINLVCYVVMIVAVILALIPALLIIAGIVSFVVGIAAIVAEILYMIFLYKSSNALA